MSDAASSAQDFALAERTKRRDASISNALILCAGALIIGLFATRRATADTLKDISFLYLFADRLCRQIIRIIDRRSVDNALAERARALVDGIDHRFSKVRIDRGYMGLTEPFWQREGDDIVISQAAIDGFSPAELDFAVASAACRRRPRTMIPYVALSMGLGSVVTFAGFGLFRFHPPVPGLCAIIVAIFILASLAGPVAWGRWRIEVGERESDIAADDAALVVTGDRDAAESALSKLYVRYSGRRSREERLRNVRHAAYRAASTTLPRRGWRPM